MTPGGVVVARSREGNEEMLEKLQERGIGAGAVETISVDEPGDWSEVDGALRSLGDFEWVVFTSPRGVALFRKRLAALSLDPSKLKARFAAVGSKTAAALNEMAIEASFVPGEFLTSALGEGLPAERGARLLLLRSDIGEKRLATMLEERGFLVSDVAIYQTKFVPGPVDPRLLDGASLVVFASPSEVEGFRRRLGPGFGAMAPRMTAACIGPVTAKAAKAAGFGAIAFPKEHTADALAAKVKEMLVDA